MRAPPLLLALLALLSPRPCAAPRPRATTDVWRYMGEASPWAGWNYSCFRCPAVVAAHNSVLVAFAEARTFTGDGGTNSFNSFRDLCVLQTRPRHCLCDIAATCA